MSSLCCSLSPLKYLSVEPGHLWPAHSCTFSNGIFLSFCQLQITLMRMVCGQSFLSGKNPFKGSLIAFILLTSAIGLPRLFKSLINNSGFWFFTLLNTRWICLVIIHHAWISIPFSFDKISNFPKTSLYIHSL